MKINGKAKGTFFVCLARKSTALNYRLVSRVQVAFVWGHNSYYYRWATASIPSKRTLVRERRGQTQLWENQPGFQGAWGGGVGPSIRVLNFI